MVTLDDVKQMLEEFRNTAGIYVSHTCKCRCFGELTDTSVFTYPAGLHVRIYPCTWHAMHWEIGPRPLFHIEKWGNEISHKYNVELVETRDCDLSHLCFTEETPKYMAQRLERQRWLRNETADNAKNDRNGEA